jgi:hypothetical protein
MTLRLVPHVEFLISWTSLFSSVQCPLETPVCCLFSQL